MKCTKALIAAAVLLVATKVGGAEEQRVVTVTGLGSASASPSCVILRGVVRGQGEKGEDAAKQHATTKEKVGKAIADVGGKVSVKFSGEKPGAATSYDEGFDIPFDAGDGEEVGGFVVTETVEIRIPFENDMARHHVSKEIGAILDKATKAGADFNTPASELEMMIGTASHGVAEFVLESPDGVRAKAHEAAFGDARRRAAGLAALADAELGKVISIEEIDETSTALEDAIMVDWGIRPDANKNPRRFTSDKNQPIVVHAKLRVVFELTD